MGEEDQVSARLIEVGKVKGDLEVSLKIAGLETWRKVDDLGAQCKGLGIRERGCRRTEEQTVTSLC